jgi:uncharacterized protein (DUF2141 family)
MATRIRKQWLDLTLSSTGLTSNDLKYNDNFTTVKSAIDKLYSNLSSYTLTIVKSGTGSGIVTSNPTGINCGSTCTYQFASGSSVTLTATPDASSTFSGWLGGATGSGSTVTVTMNSNTVVEAIFNALYTLTVVKQGNGDGTVTSNPAGINCGSTCSYQFVSGTNVTLTAAPNSVSSFNSWSGDFSSNSSTFTITMNSNKTVYATFTINEAGYFAGGYSGSTQNFIDKLLFNNGSRATLKVKLSRSVMNQSACNSSLAGYFAGGQDSDIYSFIDKLLFSNETRSTLAATLSQAMEYQSACNSTLAGYFTGGQNGSSFQSFIDKLLFSNESRTILTSTLSQFVHGQSACNSTLAGYFAGGYNGSYYSFIDKLLFSNDSRSTLTTILSQSVGYQSACNSTLSGYFTGGFYYNSDSIYYNFIDKLLFNNESRSTLIATLSQSIRDQSACNSILAGYFAGGFYGSSSSYSFIDKLLFSDEIRSTLATTLSQAVCIQSACQSGGIL